MEAFTHSIAIIKADDLGRLGTFDPWWRLLEVVDTRGLPISAGAVGRDISRSNEADLDRLAAHFRQQGHEVWNHSFAHSNMADMPAADQREDLDAAQAIIAQAFDATPTLFGAPFNATSPALIDTVEGIPALTSIWQPLSDTKLPNIPRAATLTPEYIRGFSRQPDFEHFRRRYGRVAHDHLLVVQCHPAAWNDHGREEFARVLDFLVGLNWQFATAGEYFDYRSWRDQGGRPETARARLFAIDETATDHFSRALEEPDAPPPARTDFYFNRYRRGTAPLRNLFLRHGWASPPESGGPERRGLDIGTGAGNWAFAYSGLSHSHHVVGIDRDKYLIGHLREIAREAGTADRVEFVHGSATALPFPDSEFDHVCCYNALNYFPPEAALSEIHRVLRLAPRGSAAGGYLGVQNETFYLAAFYNGLMAEKVDQALRRIDQLAYRAAERLGLVGSRVYARMWTESELPNLAGAIGLATRADVPLRERPQRFLGRDLFTVFALAKSEEPLRPRLRDDDVERDMSVAEHVVRELFEAGGYRAFLRATADLEDAFTLEPSFQRLIVASAAIADVAPADLTPPAVAAREREPRFAEAVRLHIDRKHAEAAEAFVGLADAGVDMATMAAMALYAAGRADDAYAFASERFEAAPEWNGDRWFVLLALVTATRPLAEAKRTYADYLAWRYTRQFDEVLAPRRVIAAVEAAAHRPQSRADAERLGIAQAYSALVDGAA